MHEDDNNVVQFNKYLPRKKNRVLISPKNLNQENYLLKLQDEQKNIIFAVGPAGTGKTMIACQWAVKMLHEQQIERIIITRPAVSVDEQHGFLPGDLNEKMAPWTRPLMDVFEEYFNAKEIETFIREGVIEISPLAYMRGRTFKNALVIADEMQNATPAQCKMLMTRIGVDSKIIITGDIEQADRSHGDNGLMDLRQRLEKGGVEGIAVCELEARDVQRHAIIGSVLKLYTD